MADKRRSGRAGDPIKIPLRFDEAVKAALEVEPDHTKLEKRKHRRKRKRPAK